MARTFQRKSAAAPARSRRGSRGSAVVAVEAERLAPGSAHPPGPVEASLLAVRAYRAGRELTSEQRGFVLAQLQRDLAVFLRVKRGWWDGPAAWTSMDDVLRWARGEGWRVAEVDAVLGHLALCGDVERRDGPAVGGLRSNEWRACR